MQFHRNRFLGIKISENNLVAGILETTRGLGNHGDKEIKKSILHTPYFWTYEIDPTMECIIIATEGLWQVLRYDVVVDIVTQVCPFLLHPKLTRHFPSACQLTIFQYPVGLKQLYDLFLKNMGN